METSYLNTLKTYKTPGKFQFSNFFKEGWTIGAQTFGYFLLYMIIVLGASFILSYIPYVGSYIDTYVLRPLLGVGYLVYLNHKFLTKESDFSLMFSTFKNPAHPILFQLIIVGFTFLAFLPLIIAFFVSGDFSLLLELIEIQRSGGAMSPGKVAAMEEIGNKLGEAMLAHLPLYVITMSVSFIASVLLAIFSSNGYYFIAVRNLKAWSAFKASFILAKQYFWWFVLSAIVLVLFNLLGVLVCFVGVLFTMSVTQCFMMSAFRHLTPDTGEKKEVLSDSSILDSSAI